MLNLHPSMTCNVDILCETPCCLYLQCKHTDFQKGCVKQNSNMSLKWRCTKIMQRIWKLCSLRKIIFYCVLKEKLICPPTRKLIFCSGKGEVFRNMGLSLVSDPNEPTDSSIKKKNNQLIYSEMCILVRVCVCVWVWVCVCVLLEM
jgi:hypothetical protein